MMKRVLIIALMAIAAVMTLNVSSLASTKPGTVVIGKQGWITIKSATKVDDQTLSPGDYYFSHDVLGTWHFVAFQKLGDPGLALQYSDEDTVGPPVRVDCRVEKLAERARKTEVTIVQDGTAQRITEVEIKGENVAHLF